jgi:hypothetical protein
MKIAGDIFICVANIHRMSWVTQMRTFSTRIEGWMRPRRRARASRFLRS